MYTFSFSTAANLIKSVALADNNIDYVFDDNTDPFSWEPEFNENIRYIEIRNGQELMGFIVLKRIRYNATEVHILFLKKVYGKSLDMGKQALNWIWTNMPTLDKLYATCLDDNALAIKYVEKLGFIYEGKVDKAWMKNNKHKMYKLYSVNKKYHNIIRDEV